MKTDEQYRRSFKSKIEPATDGTDCVLWKAATNNIGYGMFRHQNKMVTAHRVIMEWEGHDIKGKMVYHTCDNYHCVNPNHLRIGTAKDKVQIMVKKGRITDLTDKAKYGTCKHCDYVGPKTTVGHYHNERCKHKPT